MLYLCRKTWLAFLPHPPLIIKNLLKLSIKSKNGFILGIFLGILIYTNYLILYPGLSIWFGTKFAQRYSHVAV